MTEEEARKLIEPYKFKDVPFYGGVKRYVLHDYDVITLLMEHSNSGLKELEKRIEERIAETFVNQKILSWIVELTEGDVK